MSTYLMAGPEFHAALQNVYSDIDSTAVSVVFDYEANIDLDGSKFPYTADVSKDQDKSITAAVSKTGTCIIVYSNDDICATACHNMFYNMKALSSISFDNFSLSDCTSTRRMFMNCSSLQYLSFANMQALNISDYQEMLSGCISLKQLNLGFLACKSDTSAYNMFYNCTSLRVLHVSKQFTFTQSMNLLNPQEQYIACTDGKWHIAGESDALSAPFAESKTAAYFAVPVDSDKYNQTIVTLESLKAAVKQIAVAFDERLKAVQS